MLYWGFVLNFNSPVLKGVLGIFSFVAVIFTIISGWEQVKNKDPYFNVYTVEKDKVTAIKEIPGLSASFSFNEKAINNLWRMKIRVKSAGNDVVIGKGNRSDLIGDSFDFTFPVGYKILNLNKSEDKVFSRVEKADDRVFRVFFEQWRPDEFIDLEFVLEQDDKINIEPKVMTLSRSLIKGDVTISDYNVLEVYEEKPLISMPFGVVFMANLFVKIMNALLFLVLVLWVGGFAVDFIRYLSWEKKNRINFERFIDDLEPDPSDYKCLLETYKNNPNRLTDSIWGRFSGEKLNGSKIFDSNMSNVIFLLFSSLYILAVLILLLGR